MYLATATNKRFAVEWAGVASIDGALRFALTGVSPAAAFSVFSSTAECAFLTFNNDGSVQVFEKYSVLKSIDINPDGSIIVALGRD